MAKKRANGEEEASAGGRDPGHFYPAVIFKSINTSP